jgi:hypothetical protein
VIENKLNKDQLYINKKLVMTLFNYKMQQEVKVNREKK